MERKRHVYLKMKTREEALDILLSRFSSMALDTEIVPAPEAVGRVLAEPVFANISSPLFHSAAMDGIAVRAEATFGATESRTKKLALGKEAVYVNTGNQLPPGTDSVIMIEDVLFADDDSVEIGAASYPWQHVRKVGEDIVATQMLFPRNHQVTPVCLAALLAGGVFTVPVKEKPRVCVIPTGEELLDWRKVFPQEIPEGRILETNSWTLGALVESQGGQWSRWDVVPDDFFIIRQFVERAVNEGFHMVLVLAGSSAGSKDHTANVIQDMGQVLVHGVTIMPGKPVVLGQAKDLPVIGVPGYPVSAMVVFEEFIRPLLRQIQGLGVREEKRPGLTVYPARKIPSKLGLEELVRVKLGQVEDRVIAAPLPRGAGIITSLTDADGILRIPPESEGLSPQEPAWAELLTDNGSINKKIVAVGSHDNTLDILADEIKGQNPALGLSSIHAGSLGGLMALKRGACHIAGSHLLDTKDGSYNLSYIRKHLDGQPVRVVHLVMRDQGFMVAPENPKDIQGIKDLTRGDLTFINRQAGSGTRILLDHELKKHGIEPGNIKGYLNEETTHMAVAVAVKSTAADTGLGILAAARALGLDFIPMVREQYDLVVSRDFFQTEHMALLLKIIRSSAFKEKALALGGYHLSRTGEVIL